MDVDERCSILDHLPHGYDVTTSFEYDVTTSLEHGVTTSSSTTAEPVEHADDAEPLPVEID